MAGAPRRILLLRNDKARQGHRCDEVQAALEALGIAVTESRGRDASATILAHRDRIDAVVVAGGDGSINAAAHGLVETGLPLGIIPLGTANDLARTLAIPAKVEDAVALIASGNLLPVDLGTANDRYFFNVGSIGLSARIAGALEGRKKGVAGILPYAMAAMRSVRSSRPFHATIDVGGRIHRMKTMQISVGNGRHYGGGLTIDENARLDDGILHVVSLEPERWWGLLPAIPFLRSGRLKGRRAVRTLRGSTVTIRTRHPRAVDLDGDLLTQTPVRFGVLAGAVRVFVAGASPEQFPAARNAGN